MVSRDAQALRSGAFRIAAGQVIFARWRYRFIEAERTIVVQIHVNDERREVAAGTTIASLLADMQLQPRYVAVERNLDLVPRGRHAESILQDGDRLEIVTLVGGG